MLPQNLLHRIHSTIRLFAKLSRRKIVRKLASFALIASLLIMPGSGLALRELTVLTSTTITSTTYSLRQLPLILKSLFKMFSARTAQETTDSRSAAVSLVHILPGKFVGY